jgi:hypothetical protein
MADIEKLKYWCHKVLPLVYDESLSYYEVLCKVVQKLNEVIEAYSGSPEQITEILEAIAKLQKWVDEFDTSYAEKIIEEYLAQMIYVKLSNAGYFIYYIPESWKQIKFNTTGLDITDEMLKSSGHVDGYDYGHLVLSY